MDDFAAASRALGRLSDTYRAEDADSHAAERQRLQSRYPKAFRDLLAFSTHDARNDPGSGPSILRRFGSDIAERSSAALVAHARARYRAGAYRDAVKVFTRCLVIDPSLADATVMFASPRELSRARATFLMPARKASPLAADGWKMTMRGAFNAGRLNATRSAARRHVILEPSSPQGRDDYIKWCTWERQNMTLLARVIAACRSPASIQKIIIRPHPSENIDKRRRAYPEDGTVSVIREGDHTAWTAGARLLLHTGCTTGPS